MVFAGIYPVDADDYEELRNSMEKLQLNDASLVFELESSAALGFGFRCGFLGLLHMEIIQERLDREFPGDLERQLRRAFYLATSRDPSASEVERGLDLVRQLETANGLTRRSALECFCLLAMNLNETLYLD